MKNRQCIIFGRYADNVLGQLRSFGEIGVSSDIVFYGDDARLLQFSKYIGKLVCVSGFEEGIEYLIKHYGNNPLKNIISTDNDGVVCELDRHYSKLIDRFIFFNAGEEGRLSRFMEKNEQCKLAIECGIRVPKTEKIKIGEFPKTLQYPIFTKCIDSYDLAWKSGVCICYTKDDLIAYYNRRPQESYVLLQEYIDKKNEYILQGISINAGEDLYLPIEGGYYRLPKDAYGSYLFFKSYSHGNDFKNRLQNMFKKIRYSGVFEIEFLVGKDDTLYFLEINFRHTLWNHTFTDMGINLCKIWAESEICGKLCTHDARIKKEPHNLMREIIDFKRCRKDKSRSLWGWLKDVINTDSFVIWAKKDPFPFVYYIAIRLLKPFHLS